MNNDQEIDALTLPFEWHNNVKLYKGISYENNFLCFVVALVLDFLFYMITSAGFFPIVCTRTEKLVVAILIPIVIFSAFKLFHLDRNKQFSWQKIYITSENITVISAKSQFASDFTPDEKTKIVYPTNLFRRITLFTEYEVEFRLKDKSSRGLADQVLPAGRSFLKLSVSGENDKPRILMDLPETSSPIKFGEKLSRILKIPFQS